MKPTTPLLYLSADPARITAQLAGRPLRLEDALPLRDEVSTDEITPVAILSHFDATLGDFAHTGLRCGGQPVLGRGQLRASGIQVLVGGQRYGKGSSREHSPTAERLAGIRLVIAHSFERIYRQNADNIGLWTSTDFSLLAALEAGATLDDLIPSLLAEREGLARAVLAAGGLLRWGQHHLAEPTRARPAAHRPMTLAEKILDRHRLQTPATPTLPQPGDGVFVSADWRFIHEYYTAMADALLHQALGPGVQLRDPQQILVFEDHTNYLLESPAHQAGGLIAPMHRMIQGQRDFAKRHGLRLLQAPSPDDPEAAAAEAGISHAVMAERFAQPGQLVVGTDSHTPHSGALGCLAFGVGTTDMAHAFVTGAVRVCWPDHIQVRLDGRLPPGVTAKDLALHLLALPFIRHGGGVGRVFEFGGPGITSLDTDERATLTNLCAELGGLSGIVAPDAETVRFVRERRGIEIALEPWMHSDPGARYAETIAVDLATLAPRVARPGDPGQGLPLHALDAPVKIDIAYGGSCTAGKRADFDHYHAVLAWGLAQGLRPPPGVQVFLQYGTTAVRDYCRAQGYESTFEALGVRLLLPSCGACANCGPGASTHPDQVTVSAINRNFPGRSGPGQVWLASPPTVMASALAGELISWEALKARVEGDGLIHQKQ